MKEAKGIKVKIKDIHPNIKNPRKGTYNKNDILELKESLESLGQITAIKITTDGKILGGHRRYQAMKELGWKTCDADVIKIKSAFHESSLLISDNTTQKAFNAFDFRQTINDVYWNEFLEEYEPRSGNDKGYKEFAKRLGISGSQIKVILDSMQGDNMMVAEKLKSNDLGSEALDTILRLPKKHRESLTNYAIKLKKKKNYSIRESLRNKAYVLRLDDMEHEPPKRVFFKVKRTMNAFNELFNKTLFRNLSQAQLKEVKAMCDKSIMKEYVNLKKIIKNKR